MPRPRGWRTNQTIAAIKKLEEAQQAYPNSFESAFALGYLNMMRDDKTAATNYLNQALHLRQTRRKRWRISR